MQKEIAAMRAKANRRGKAFSGKAAAKAIQRKEQYLGARVPKELRDRVIRRAAELGMPVSILIRDILEQAIGHSRPIETAAEPAASPAQARHMDGTGRFPNVLGWKRVLLNKSVDCAGCGVRLDPGVSITLGLAGPGEEHVVLCQRCKRVA